MPEGLLLPGEQVLLVTRRHFITLLMPLLVIAGATGLFFSQVCPVAVAERLDGRCPLVAALICAAAALPFALDWLTTRFILTNQRLILRQAPVWRRTQSLRLSGIESLSLREDILGRFLAFGDVVADSTATQGGRLVLDYVPGPEQVRDRIAAAIAASRAG